MFNVLESGYTRCTTWNERSQYDGYCEESIRTDFTSENLDHQLDRIILGMETIHRIWVVSVSGMGLPRLELLDKDFSRY